jgi:thioredoxin reductase/ferredoxin
VTWVVPLALGGLAIITMGLFTMLSARKRQQVLVAPPATVGPRILVHDINDDRCTGCDACVAVCPTNVLDLVSNKSRVLRFEDCIQCEACMTACPTEALVMFPEGTMPPPLKVPEIDENFQTAIMGQYLIGEVAGKPLVKNAANLGRVVVEHILTSGMRVGALGRGETTVDVVIVGSGPGGLSAALTCVQRGLSYVVLEKEQMIASTITRYPKGKLVMAEPYDTMNLSLLPVFDSSKESLIPIWTELIERIGVVIRQGESVEQVTRQQDGTFETRTTVNTYRSQRVILSIGTRGKPRTLQVPGENLPKIFSLLEDPDVWAGRAALVVGGGDSACEAALALADSGAKVTISYRGKGFNRAAPKNKQAIERYAAEGRIKAKLGSQVIVFDETSVTLALADGSQKKYANDATFVLIGADPPVQWLEKMGVRFVERPHQYQTGKSDDIVRRFVANPIECPEDAARAAAQVLGGSVGPAPPKQATGGYPMPDMMPPMPLGEPVKGPRKWLRSATSIFSNKLGTNPNIQRPQLPPPSVDPRAASPAMPGVAPPRGGKKFEQPVPLSEFAKRQRGQSTGVGPTLSGTNPGIHTGHGRRDQLTAGERTRILRMLRDEGGRQADEDSQVYIGAVPPRSAVDADFDFDDSPVPAPLPTKSSQMAARGDVPAKPAMVVGLAQAQAAANARKRNPSKAPPLRLDEPPMVLPPDPPAAAPPRTRNSPPTNAPPRPRNATGAPPRRTVPPPFSDEPTRQVDDEIIAALRQHDAQQPRTAPAEALAPPPARLGAAPVRSARYDEPTRMALQAAPPGPLDGGFDPPTIAEDALRTKMAPLHLGDAEDDQEEATRMASVDSMAALARKGGKPGPTAPPPVASSSSGLARPGKGRPPGARRGPPPPKSGATDDSTRAVDIRSDGSISDIDWDLE